jgi:hypothetical protein
MRSLERQLREMNDGGLVQTGSRMFQDDRPGRTRREGLQERGRAQWPEEEGGQWHQLAPAQLQALLLLPQWTQLLRLSLMSPQGQLQLMRDLLAVLRCSQAETSHLAGGEVLAQLPQGDIAVLSPARFFLGCWGRNVHPGRRQGLEVIPSRHAYSGQFEGNRRSGQGVCCYLDRSCYSGSWLNDAFEGNGALTASNGDRYEGGFMSGRKAGRGREAFRGGDCYQGHYLNNLFEGEGTSAETQASIAGQAGPSTRESSGRASCMGTGTGSPTAATSTSASSLPASSTD